LLRCLYVDLDGTLLGHGGSLLHDGEGNFSLRGARALEACARAGVEVVIFSGRKEVQVVEDARLIGARAYIFEIGAGLVVDGEREWLTGGLVPDGERTIHDLIAETGAPQLLLQRFAGRLEPHDPWHLNREVSHLFRGDVEPSAVEDLLREHGCSHLRLVDNGVSSHRYPGLDVETVRVYHLLPAESSKARAVARHRQIRGYAAEECLAVGDSREDMDAAAVVGSFWLVGNATARDPSLPAAVGGRPNVRIAEEPYGAGVYEAVITTLAEAR
jgi:hydroxymethylpyrimidine pyrophosphatase-like HAD family hydrolase